jgi:hypothetical protein
MQYCKKEQKISSRDLFETKKHSFWFGECKNYIFLYRYGICLTKSQTTIVNAHRVSTIRNADKVVVVDKGVMLECGTHEELLAHNGLYATLWAKQNGRTALCDSPNDMSNRMDVRVSTFLVSFKAVSVVQVHHAVVAVLSVVFVV